MDNDNPLKPLPAPPEDLAAALALADALTVDAGLARLLCARGLGDAAAAARFLFPSLADASPPGDLPDLVAAADILTDACGPGGGKIFVAGDYDVDGLCATAVITHTLRSLGADVVYYIPNRLTEGYDLSAATVKRARDAGARTLLTVDCGSRAHEAVAAARDAGLTVVITDHHRLMPTLPDANAVVTPQRLPEGHGARGLAACGVAYKLAVELLARREGTALEPAWLLPLVALGTVCDVVDLQRENRTLVAAALKEFPGPLLPGLRALMETAGVAPGAVSSWQLAYILGPRLNAAGRLGHASYALELLLAADEERALKLAKRLNQFNAERRGLEDRVGAAAFSAAAEQMAEGRRTVVLAGEGWHPGVIGIVASRLVEKFYRPTVLIALDGDAGRGSCRSIPAFDIHKALEHSAGRLRRFGGHRQAAGFEISRAEIIPFADEFDAFARAALRDEDLVPAPRVDAALPLVAVTPALAADLALFEPVGQGNPAPAFLSYGDVAPDAQRVFKNAHVELFAAAGPTRLRAIGFNLAPGGEVFPPGRYGLVYTPTPDARAGGKKVQLKLQHVAPATPAEANAGPRVTDARNRKWDLAVADYDAARDAVYGLPSQEGLAGGGLFVPYAFTCGPGRNLRRVFVVAPPPDAHRLGALAAAAEELVFAFGGGDVEAARRFVRRLYPDKDFVDAVYRTIRDGGALDAGDAGAKRAVAVFVELGLMVETAAGPTVLAAHGDKKQLADSPLFHRCERLRRDAESFIGNLGDWPGAALEAVIRDVTTAAKPLDTAAGMP